MRLTGCAGATYIPLQRIYQRHISSFLLVALDGRLSALESLESQVRSLPARLGLPITANIHCETPTHLLADPKKVAPRRHRSGVGEPIVPGPTRIASHSNVDIPEPTHNLDVAAFPPPLRFSAAAVGAFE